MIRILVVDDQELVRAGVTRILGPEDDMAIVGECEDGTQVPAAVEALRPDIVLMDVRMKQVSGPDATAALAATADPPPVLILTTFDDDEVVAASLSAGAAGFILKDAPGEELIRATRLVAEGGSWLDPRVTGRVLAAFRTSVEPRAARARELEELTPRERDVLELMGRGLTNQEIAAELVISTATVKTHVSHVLGKLDLRDRAAAVVLAFDSGLVQPGQADA